MDDGTSVVDFGPVWNTQYGSISLNGCSVPCAPVHPGILEEDKEALQKRLQV